MSISAGSRVVRRAAFVISAGALVAALLVPAAASAGGRGATVIRGIQNAAGTCADGGYFMQGSLDGCWWVDTFDVKPMPVQGTVLARGTEHFEGCLGSVCGSFKTTYTYTARFDGAVELQGRCHHPIKWGSGTGGFTGARGQISFTDVVDAEPFFYPYWGNIQLASGSEATSLGVSSQSAMSSTGATSTVTGAC